MEGHASSAKKRRKKNGIKKIKLKEKMKSDHMLIDWVDIHTVVPNPKNPNEHSAEQVTKLAQLIKRQGWRHPIIVSTRSGFITAGHCRLSAAKELKLKKVPVHFQEFLTEAQEYEFLISDNAISLWSHLDLASINLNITEFGPDLDLGCLALDGFELEPADKKELQKKIAQCPSCGFVLNKKGDEEYAEP